MINSVEKWGEDARMEGKRAYIGGGTVSRSVYRKEKMGAPKKPPMYLHIQIESGAHRVGRTPENVNKLTVEEGNDSKRERVFVTNLYYL